MLPTAMQFLSVDVRSAIDRVQDVLQQITEAQQWGWSYPRLIGALRGMQSENFSIIHTRGTTDTSSDQIKEYRKKAGEAKTNTILNGCAIVGGGIAAALALPVVVTGALGLVGFSAGGVVAGE